MAIKIVCQSCGAKGTASDQAAGRQTTCPKCGAPLKIPPLAAAVDPATPAPVQPVEEEIPSVLPVDEPAEVLPAEAYDEVEVVEDQLEVVEDAEPVQPRPKAGRGRVAGLLKLQRFLIEGQPGGFNTTAGYEIINPDTDRVVGGAGETGAMNVPVLNMLAGGRSNFASMIEVFQGAKEDLVFTMERSGTLGRLMAQQPGVKVLDARGRPVGSIRNRFMQRTMDVFDWDDQPFADVCPEGKPPKWYFRTTDGRTLGSFVTKAMRRPGSLLQSAQGCTILVSASQKIAEDAEAKMLLLASALFMDLNLFDAMARATFRP